MHSVSTDLKNQELEFRDHIALALAIERRLMQGESLVIESTALSSRHLMTIKSGLIVHLYNIVESTMTQVLTELGSTILSHPPTHWHENTLKEWLRYQASFTQNGDDDTRLQIVYGAALKLLDKTPLDEVKFKKPSGTWSDKLIALFCKRLNITFCPPRDVWILNKPDAMFADKTPMEFLADRRNAIAHGRRSFEKGADDLSLQDITKLADATLQYMGSAIEAFQFFVDSKSFITATA